MQQLIEQIRLGPVQPIMLTKEEKILKYIFLVPLNDKDRSAQKLGTLNKNKVWSVLTAVLYGFGYKHISLWNYGFIVSTSKPWLGTSLDGWIQLQRNDKDASKGTDKFVDSDDAEALHRPIHCCLDIKTPSMKEIKRQLLQCAILHSKNVRCVFGDAVFKQIVYLLEYRCQLLIIAL